MLDLYTDNCTPTTCEGDRVLRIITANPCDEIITVVDGDMGDDDIEEEVRIALRHKFGRYCPDYRGYEDVTELWSKEPERYNGLEDYLGEFVGDYDLDAMESEFSYVDYGTGNRYWKPEYADMADDEFFKAVERFAR